MREIIAFFSCHANITKNRDDSKTFEFLFAKIRQNVISGQNWT